MPIHKENLDEVATKRYVNEKIDLAQTVKAGFDRTATKDDLNKLKSEVKEIKSDMKNMKEEIIHEFKVVAENIHQDVAGANQDEISLIKNQKLPDHEKRIQVLEKTTHISVGPRY